MKTKNYIKDLVADVFLAVHSIKIHEKPHSKFVKNLTSTHFAYTNLPVQLS